MRFILIHKTNERWEAGEVPSPELIARVGKLLGDLAREKALLGGEGLRASAQGARIRRSGGAITVRRGPFEGDNELPAAFSIVEVESLDEAIAWAKRLAEALGDVEIDVRPLTEPWDIGMAPRPEGLTTRRYMALRKATAASEAGEPLSPKQQAEVARLIDETTRAGVHLKTETLRPSRRGRRYKNTRDGVRTTDGPFTESKELIAGYMMVSAASLEDAARWVQPYMDAAEADEVDLRELDDPS